MPAFFVSAPSPGRNSSMWQFGVQEYFLVRILIKWLPLESCAIVMFDNLGITIKLTQRSMGFLYHRYVITKNLSMTPRRMYLNLRIKKEYYTSLGTV